MTRHHIKIFRAFTLVELLVVIGIIAVLIGILLPIIGRARDSARTLACSAQLRGHMQGLLTYAAENRGSFPYGVAWQTTQPGTLLPQLGVSEGFSGSAGFYARAYHWWTVLQSMYVKDGRAGVWPQYGYSSNLTLTESQVKLNKSFVCPEATLGGVADDVPNTYAGHSVIMPNPSFEVSGGVASVTYNRGSFNGTTGTPSSQFVTGTTSIAPAKLSQLYPDNAVLWDTVIWRNSRSVESGQSGTFQAMNLWGGFAWSTIDYGRLAHPRAADWRYRGEMKNPAPKDDPKDSIFLPSMAFEKKNFSAIGFHFVNADVVSDTKYVYYMQYGTPRFRHNRDTTCNVAFADGSVRSVTASFNKVDKVKGPFGEEKAPNQFIREWLQIKRPGGLPAQYNGKGSY